MHLTTTLPRRVALIAALCAAFATATGSAAAADAARTSIGRLPAGPAELIVTFADRPAASEVARRLAGLGEVRELVPEVGAWQLTPDVTDARRRVLGRPDVVRAEWSTRKSTADLPEPTAPVPTLPLQTLPPAIDPLLAAPNGQWSMRMGTWAEGTAAYERPIIAILDSGLDIGHEEFREPGLIVSPYSTITRRPRAPDVSTEGHGTHVAGIAAAPMNAIGIVGVAPASASGRPGTSRIMPVQIANSAAESSDRTMMQGIRWAVNRGARVINISSGGPGYSQAFQDTVNWAYRRGALIVSSVGNEGYDDNEVNFPAGYDHVIGVAAQCERRVSRPDCPTPLGAARFSNYNYSVDVIAPGVNILSTLPLSVQKGAMTAGYGYKEGTSMAAPYVAGTLALIYASHPGISPYQATEILLRTSSRAVAGRARTSREGWGAVDPLRAVQAPTPQDDLVEPNDDVKFAAPGHMIRLSGTTRRVIRGAADFNNDQFDVYSVAVGKGQRVRVVISAPSGRMDMAVFRPGTTSINPRVRNPDWLAQRMLTTTRRYTPGTRAAVFRAPVTGRYIISVAAMQGGGRYTLTLQRL